MGDTDPADALDTLELELVIADLASVEGRLDRQSRASKGDKSLAAEIAALERAAAILGDGVPLYRSDLSADERAHLAPAFLLTDKPVARRREHRRGPARRRRRRWRGHRRSATTRSRCASSSRRRRPRSIPRRAPRCSKASVSASAWCPASPAPPTTCSGRRTFLTTGDKESRAWTFRAGANAPECAGVIHSDLQRGFIRAEVIDGASCSRSGRGRRRRTQGGCASRARTTSSRTATCSRSASTFEPCGWSVTGRCSRRPRSRRTRARAGAGSSGATRSTACWCCVRAARCTRSACGSRSTSRSAT